MKRQLLLGRLLPSALVALLGGWAANTQSVSDTYIELTTKNANDPLEITVAPESSSDKCWIDLNGNNKYDGTSEDAPRYYGKREKSIATVRVYGNAKEFSANRTSLVKIAFSHNPTTLKEVSIKGNPDLTEVILSKSAQLESLDVDDCKALAQLAFPSDAKLITLSCSGTSIKNLDLSKVSLLSTETCNNMGLTTLNVSMLKELTTLSCFGNKLPKLDVSQNKKLSSLKCNNSEIEELVLGDVSTLHSFSVNDNKIKNLDLSKLTKVLLQNNQLEKLLFSKEITGLSDICVFGNNLGVAAMESMIASLPKRASEDGSLFIVDTKAVEKNVCTKKAVAQAKALGWIAYDWQNGMGEEGYNKYEGSDPSGDKLGKMTLTANTKEGKWSFYFAAAEEDKANCWVDLNGDGKKDAGEEITNWSMYLSPVSYARTSNSLTIYGNITEFNCGGNDLTAIEVVENPALKTLRCANNPIAKIDMTQLPNLLELMASHTKISSLDLSKNKVLRDLYIQSCENISEVNLSANTELRELNVGFIKGLKSLDVSKNEKLVTLFCDTTSIASLDFSHNPIIDRIEARGTGLKSLTFKGNDKLRVLFCNDNPLGKLDLSECPAIEELHAHRAELSEVNLKGLAKVKTIWIDRNKLTQLDVTSCKELSELDIRNNQLTTIDLSACEKLLSLFAEHNKLTKLAFSNCKIVDVISCSQNNLEGEAVDKMIASLPVKDATFGTGNLFFVDQTLTGDHNKIYEDQVKAAADKAWTVYDNNGGTMKKYLGEPRGVESVLTEEVSLFPVPADTEITLNIPTEMLGAVVTIFDATGAKVREFTATALSTTLNVEDLKAGVYVLSIGTIAKTFVVR